MLIFVGYIIVVGSVFDGYALAGGHLGAMYQPLELLMIGDSSSVMQGGGMDLTRTAGQQQMTDNPAKTRTINLQAA